MSNDLRQARKKEDSVKFNPKVYKGRRNVEIPIKKKGVPPNIYKIWYWNEIKKRYEESDRYDGIPFKKEIKVKYIVRDKEDSKKWVSQTKQFYTLEEAVKFKVDKIKEKMDS